MNIAKPKLISKTLVEKGRWHQPYIHSDPANFNYSQKTHYKSFTIDGAAKKLKKKAETIFNSLVKYYTAQDKKLMEFLEYSGSHEEYLKDSVNFVDEFEKQYTNAMINGKYKRVKKLQDDLKKLEKGEKKAAKIQKKSVENILTEQLKKVKYTPGKAAKYKKQQRLVLSTAEDILTEILKEANVENPNILIDETLKRIARGQRFDDLDGELNKSIKAIEKVLPTIIALLNMLSQLVSVETLEGTARKNTPSKQMGQAMGIFNEFIVGDVITSVIDRVIGQSSNKLFKNLKKGKTKFIPVGRIDTGGDVADTKVFLENKRGETFSFGIDVKYTMTDTDGKTRKYERGGRSKVEASEVLEFAPIEDVSAMMYLMTNSYFLGAEAEGDWYNKFLGGHDGEIFKLFNIILGLYGLLPPDAVFRKASLKYVEELVRNDSRMFVTINETAIPMVTFLNAVRKQVLDAGNMGKPIRKLRANFEKIMEQMRAEAGGQIKKSIPAKGLYASKIDLITELLQREDFSRFGYWDLKTKITDKITGTKLYNWNYKIDQFIYTIDLQKK